MGSERLSLRLPEELRAGLEGLVATTGRTESELAREAIEEYVRRHAEQPSCFELASEAGLIGCVEGKVRDRSTNSKHMEGFGR